MVCKPIMSVPSTEPRQPAGWLPFEVPSSMYLVNGATHARKARKETHTPLVYVVSCNPH